jgi:hypothetical protein
MSATDEITNARAGKRGRKQASESRASEIRTKLLTWTGTPEPQRVSLRALARELRTSHQLLGTYLKGLKKWQEKDYRRRAESIREHALAENRSMTPAEEGQAAALDRAGLRLMIESVLDSAFRTYEREFREMEPGTLRGEKLRFLKALARRGVPFAQKLLQKRET